MVTINTSTILAVSSATVGVFDADGNIIFVPSPQAVKEKVKEKAKETGTGLRKPTSKERRKVIDK